GRPGAGDRHRHRFRHRLPGAPGARGHQHRHPRRFQRARPRPPGRGRLRQRPPGNRRRPGLGAGPAIRRHRRHRRGRRPPGAFRRLAAARRPPVRRARPLAGAGSPAADPRRRRPDARKPVRNRHPLPAWRRTDAALRALKTQDSDMRLSLRPLSFAILLAGAAGTANAADLMQAYELARQSDPQLSAAESRSLAQGEGVVQSRAALLPQLDGEVSWSRTETDSSGSQAFGTVVQPASVSTSESTSRGWGVNLRQSIYDHGNYTRLNAAKARAAQAEAEYKAAQDALIVRVADAYFNVLTAIETLA